MTLSQIASLIAKGEGGKHKMKIGDAREVVAILSDQIFAEFVALNYTETPKVPTLRALYLNGKKRNKKQIMEAIHGDETAQTQQQTGSNEYSDSAEGESVDP